MSTLNNPTIVQDFNSSLISVGIPNQKDILGQREDTSYALESNPLVQYKQFLFEDHGEVTSMQGQNIPRCLKEADVNLMLLHRSYGLPFFSEKLLPAIYLIELTNACDLNCVFCPHSHLSESSFMSLQLIKKLLGEIKSSAKLIKLNYIGEPLLHPQFDEILKLCKTGTNARIALSTSAKHLDEDLAAEIVELELDEITFSLDAATPETYQKIKGCTDFTQVVKNIKNFLQLNNGSVRAVVKLIEMNVNRQEIELFKELWADYKCEVRVSWINTWAGQLPNLKNLSTSFCPNRHKPRMPCADLWYKMVINAKGLVPLCCNDFSGTKPLGDVNDQCVEDIWNSDTLRFYRRAHSESGFKQLGLCAECLEWSGKDDLMQYLNIKDFPLGRP